jgi:serpin B
MKYRLPVVASFVALFGATPILRAASPAATDTASRNNSFAADLYAQLNRAGTDKNVFLSPYSISAALAMTAQGARGKTADQMNSVLHIGPDFQNGMAEITAGLNPKDAPFELSVSNALWVEQTFHLAVPFVDECRKNYNAAVLGVDFVNNSDAARKTINDSIAAQTHDKIKDLLAPNSVDRSTALVLTDAIYFKGTWETPFPKNATTDQPFHAPGGKDVTVPLMKSPSGTMYGYSETDEAQILSLAYKAAPATPAAGGAAAENAARLASNKLSMLIVLPRKVDGLAEIEKQATAANIDKWAAGLRRQPVQVYLPRFTMTSEFELSKELKALGMTDAFARSADFSGISASADGKLFISSVIHKAFVDVNEEGTEAAAASAVTMVRSMAMPGNRVEFRADHPFLFLIRHEPTGSILFMGHVTNPK